MRSQGRGEHAMAEQRAVAAGARGAVSLFAFAVLVVGLAALVPPSVAAGEIKHILVIYFNDRLEQDTVEADSGFREALAESNRAEVDAEFLDTPGFGFNQEAFQSALVTFLRTTYSQEVPNVIVAVGEQALDFMLRNRSELFPLTPIVHEGVAEWFLRQARPLPADVVGAAVDYDFSATIEQALQWRRQARRLVVVTGASSSDQLREPELSKVVSRFKDRVTVELLRGRPTSVVLKRLGQPRRRRGWGRAKNWRINPMHWPMHQR